MLGWQNASYRTGAACTVIGQSLLPEAVKLAGLRIAFDPVIEASSFERFEPSADPGKLFGRKS